MFTFSFVEKNKSKVCEHSRELLLSIFAFKKGSYSKIQYYGFL